VSAAAQGEFLEYAAETVFVDNTKTASTIMAGSQLKAYTAGGPVRGAAMIQDVPWALWFIALLIVAYRLAIGDLCLWRRDD
jgi:hypothetical protein